jgi:hypothetical protein
MNYNGKSLTRMKCRTDAETAESAFIRPKSALVRVCCSVDAPRSHIG